MSNANKGLLSLLFDVAEETVERARIKAQQNRIMEIIRIDKRELDTIYAKIGRIDVLGGDSKKREELCAEAKRIEGRVLRAQIRFDMLKESASVDQCTKAFTDKLNETLEKVQRETADKAQDIKASAKEKSADIKDKIKSASADFSAKASAKAEDLTIMAKDKAVDLSVKAKDKAADLTDKAKEKAKNTASKAKEKLSNVKSDEKNSKPKTEDTVLDNVDDILKRIEDTINSVDADDTPDTKTKDNTDTETADEAESAESFTF